MITLPSSEVKNIFGGVAIAGIIAAAWSQIKMVLHKIVSFGIVTVTIQNDARTVISFFVMRKLRRSKWTDPTFNTAHKYVRPAKRFLRIFFETLDKSPAVVYYGKVPLLLSADTVNCNYMRMVFIRGTMNLDAFLTEAQKFFNQFAEGGFQNSRRFHVCRKYGKLGQNFAGIMFSGKGDSASQSGGKATAAGREDPNEWFMMGRLVGWKDDDLGEGQRSNRSAMDALAYPAPIDQLFTSIKRWKGSEDWYSERNIPWRLGMLLHGEPGTGKSAFVRATGIDLDMPVYILDIGTMTNEEFVDAWECALAQAPVIVLLEDFDAVFTGRKRNSDVDGGLTFDCLLSRVSGVENSDGVVLFITTNKIETIDSAIGQQRKDSTTRPGRIDIIAEFKGMEAAERFRLARMIMSDMAEADMAQAVKDGEGETGAQFQARCTKLALDYYWNKQNWIAVKNRNALLNAVGT